MKSPIERNLPRLTPEQSLPVIFADHQVAAHIKKMHTIGTKRMQESAFVVYQTGESVTASKLYRPDPTVGTAYTETDRQQRYESVNIAHLIRHELSEDDYAGYNESPDTQAKIAAIGRSYELDEYDRMLLIEDVREADMLRQKSMHPSGYRDDVLFVAHNHPQHPSRRVAAADLLVPSPTDVESHDRLAQANVGIVDAIIAGSATSRGILLFAAESHRGQDPHAYEGFYDNNKVKSNRLALGRCGYIFVMLELDKNGQLAHGQSQALRDFARQVKCS